MKIRWDVSFATRKVIKGGIILVLRVDWKRKVKLNARFIMNYI